MSVPKITIEEIEKIVKYNPDIGEFRYVKDEKLCPLSTYPTKGEDYYILLMGCVISCKRLAFGLMNKCWPTQKVDYIDGDFNNLKWENLHLVNRKNQSPVRHFKKDLESVFEMVEYFLKGNNNKDLYMDRLKKISSNKKYARRLIHMKISDIIFQLKTNHWRNHA